MGRTHTSTVAGRVKILACLNGTPEGLGGTNSEIGRRAATQAEYAGRKIEPVRSTLHRECKEGAYVAAGQFFRFGRPLVFRSDTIWGGLT